MRPNDTEPGTQEYETLVRAEEQELLADPNVPDEVKSEIEERLERFEERELETERAEGAGNELSN